MKIKLENNSAPSTYKKESFNCKHAIIDISKLHNQQLEFAAVHKYPHNFKHKYLQQSWELVMQQQTSNYRN